MLLLLLIERASWDAKSLCGLLDAAALFLKDAFYVLFFQFQLGQARVEEWGADLCVSVKLKVLESDVLLPAQQHRTFNNIAKLSDVARPRIGLKGLNATFIKIQLTTA